ncbi:MAG: DMT family transporter [Rhodobacteraceae bacterium]|jgi:drug/metabolite transporter (DMT)-like permease|nr:DMT family transporter [Paracoccaceae bacterium]
MPRKSALDAPGLAVLLGVTLLFSVNQVIIKFTNQGLQPVFFAGLRSVLAVGFVIAWMRYRSITLDLTPAMLRPGLLIGAMFSVEFIFLFLALDLTTLGRASVIFYSMPLWFAVMAHYGLNAPISPRKAIGLALAFAGTALAILSRGGGAGAGSLVGDLCALGGAIGWAATAYVARRPAMAAAGPERQLLWMVLVSGPILLLAAPAFGPLLRDPAPIHVVLLLVQASIIVAGGFITWLWLLSTYPVATVASFSFLTPVFSLLLGRMFFSEPLQPALIVAAALVGAGIALINLRG